MEFCPWCNRLLKNGQPVNVIMSQAMLEYLDSNDEPVYKTICPGCKARVDSQYEERFLKDWRYRHLD